MLKMYLYLLIYKDIQDWIREKSKITARAQYICHVKVANISTEEWMEIIPK